MIDAIAPQSNYGTFGLERFLDAQFPMWERILNELRNGRKVSCWMWFVFPQLRGLGSSPTACRYAISGLAEAGSYLQHPILGARLAECTELALSHSDQSAAEIFGGCDGMKFHSSLTLFSRVPQAPEIFQQAMTAFFDGWSRSIPSGIDLKVHRPIDAAVAGKAAACSCGGRFQGDASPRCIHCHAELDPVASAEFIERNAPGTKKGRRWQRSWQGLYAIVVEGRSVNDPWTSGGGAA